HGRSGRSARQRASPPLQVDTRGFGGGAVLKRQLLRLERLMNILLNERDVSEYESRIKALSPPVAGGVKQCCSKQLKNPRLQGPTASAGTGTASPNRAYDKNIARLEKDYTPGRKRDFVRVGVGLGLTGRRSGQVGNKRRQPRRHPRRTAAASSESIDGYFRKLRPSQKHRSTASPSVGSQLQRGHRAPKTAFRLIEAVEEGVRNDAVSEQLPNKQLPPLLEHRARSRRTASMTEEIEAARFRVVVHIPPRQQAVAASYPTAPPPAAASVSGGKSRRVATQLAPAPTQRIFEDDEASRRRLRRLLLAAASARRVLDSRDRQRAVQLRAKFPSVSEPEPDQRRHEEAEEAFGVQEPQSTRKKTPTTKTITRMHPTSARTPRTHSRCELLRINEEYSFPQATTRNWPAPAAAEVAGPKAGLVWRLNRVPEEQAARTKKKTNDEESCMSARTIIGVSDHTQRGQRTTANSVPSTRASRRPEQDSAKRETVERRSAVGSHGCLDEGYVGRGTSWMFAEAGSGSVWSIDDRNEDRLPRLLNERLCRCPRRSATSDARLVPSSKLRSSAAKCRCGPPPKPGRAFAVGIHQLVTDEKTAGSRPAAAAGQPLPAGADSSEASIRWGLMRRPRPTAAVGPADWEPPERTRYFLRPRFRRAPAPSDEAELVEAFRQPRWPAWPAFAGCPQRSSPADTFAPSATPPAHAGKLQALVFLLKSSPRRAGLG
uniref:INCENP_ARK-bind domain-containing protein n=1 Tax=Macrostomum lignano TaxID=282301 RepID=A0A1I8FC37_9PLAT